jgi:DNA-binding cell septation regulator SpoVG
MRNKFLAARVYRERAEELRTIADGLTRDIERDLLNSIAQEYDRQAKSAEARGRAALTAGLY